VLFPSAVSTSSGNFTNRCRSVKVSDPTIFGSYLKREFLYDEETGQLSPWPSTVEDGRRRYLPYSPRAWRQAKLEPVTETDQVEPILESGLTEDEETPESREVIVTPEDQSVTATPLPSANDQDYSENRTGWSWK
jgi:hypothetical protein